MDLTETSTVDPKHHWYFLHKRNYLLSQIRRFAERRLEVIDVGSGTGFFAKEIVKKFPELNVTCVDTNFQRKDLGTRGGINYLADSSAINGGEIFLFMDVIEHVSNDRQLVSEYLDKTDIDALVIFTVPAFNWLWSGHDVALKHFRRYNRKQLLELANDLNLEIMVSRYLFTPIFPLVFLKRLRKSAKKNHNDLRPQSRLINYLLLNLLKLDNFSLTRFLPGSTAVLIAKKRVN